MELIDALESAVPLLAEKDVSFAQSLVAQHQQGKPLTPKQMYWVGVLLKKAGIDATALSKTV